MKNICLGIFATNEEYFLSKTLRYNLMQMAEVSNITGLVYYDFGSTDNTFNVLQEILKPYRERFKICLEREFWQNDFSFARNTVIRKAESLEYNAMIMLDADECLTADSFRNITKYLDDYDNLALPRIEFVMDYGHFDPSIDPDKQGRVFKLNMGYHYNNKVHEMLHDAQEVNAWYSDRFCFATNCTIYHYGRSREDIKRTAIKYINYDRQTQGLEPLTELPDGYSIEGAKFWNIIKKFNGYHPLQNLQIQ